MKICKACKTKFTPWNSLQVACGPRCALVVAKMQTEKKARQAKSQARAETRQALERIKTRGQHMKEAQVAFNAYVRARDEGLPCISCGKMTSDKGLLTGSRWDAGHYRSVGSCPSLRFEELNCHRQDVRCNRDLSGNVVEYRGGLIERIGQQAVDWLEGPHEPKKYTIEDLKEIKAHYRKLARELKNKREAA